MRRGLVGDGAIFVGAGLTQRLLAFLVVPLLAARLGPEEYGRTALLLSLAGLLTTLVSCGLETPVFRAMHLARDHAGRHSVVSTGLGVLGVACCAVLIPSVISVGIASGETTLSTEAALIMLGSVPPTVVFTGLVLPVLRAQGRAGAYGALVLAFAGGQCALRLLLVDGEDGGAARWMVADAISPLVVAVAGLLLLRPLLRPRVDRAEAGKLLALGLPMLPHLVSHWGLSLSDRVVLAPIVSAAELGTYSFVYQLVAVQALVLAEVNRAVMGAHGKAAAGTVPHAYLVRVERLQVLGTFGLSATALLAGPPLLRLIATNGFEDGVSFAVPLVLAFTLYGLYYPSVNELTVRRGESKGLWRATAVAATVNVVANLALVPRFGIAAAAWTTLLGYGALLFLVVRRTSWRAPLTFAELGLVIGALLPLAALAHAAAGRPGILLGVLLGSFLVYLAVLGRLATASFGSGHEVQEP